MLYLSNAPLSQNHFDFVNNCDKRVSAIIIYNVVVIVMMIIIFFYRFCPIQGLNVTQKRAEKVYSFDSSISCDVNTQYYYIISNVIQNNGEHIVYRIVYTEGFFFRTVKIF